MNNYERFLIKDEGDCIEYSALHSDCINIRINKDVYNHPNIHYINAILRMAVLLNNRTNSIGTFNPNSSIEEVAVMFGLPYKIEANKALIGSLLKELRSNNIIKPLEVNHRDYPNGIYVMNPNIAMLDCVNKDVLDMFE